MTNRPMEEIVRNQKPHTLEPDATVQQACELMRQRRIGAVLVTQRAKLMGIFTGRDAVRVLAEGRDAAVTRLDDVMTQKPETMPPGRTAVEALRLMHDAGFRHLPVVDEAGVLRGIVSYGDFRGLEHDRLDEETGYWERIG